MNEINAPPTASPKVKRVKRRVRARSLARSILGVEGETRAPGWGLGRLTSRSITHTCLHKPINKLISA